MKAILFNNSVPALPQCVKNWWCKDLQLTRQSSLCIAGQIKLQLQATSLEGVPKGRNKLYLFYKAMQVMDSVLTNCCTLYTNPHILRILFTSDVPWLANGSSQIWRLCQWRDHPPQIKRKLFEKLFLILHTWIFLLKGSLPWVRVNRSFQLVSILYNKISLVVFKGIWADVQHPAVRNGNTQT